MIIKCLYVRLTTKKLSNFATNVSSIPRESPAESAISSFITTIRLDTIIYLRYERITSKYFEIRNLKKSFISKTVTLSTTVDNRRYVTAHSKTREKTLRLSEYFDMDPGPELIFFNFFPQLLHTPTTPQWKKWSARLTYRRRERFIAPRRFVSFSHPELDFQGRFCKLSGKVAEAARQPPRECPWSDDTKNDFCELPAL